MGLVLFLGTTFFFRFHQLFFSHPRPGPLSESVSATSVNQESLPRQRPRSITQAVNTTIAVATTKFRSWLTSRPQSIDRHTTTGTLSHRPNLVVSGPPTEFRLLSNSHKDHLRVFWVDFDFAGLRQGARQTEHLRANRCLIYGQTVLHFESGLLFSWPPIWQPVESVEPVRAPSFPPSVPCPRRDRPGPRQGRVCTTTAPVLQRQRESPAQKPERSIAD